jgi:hypothetical protein
MPLDMGFLVYYQGFPPLFSYKENLTNSLYNIFYKVVAYKISQKLGGY